MTRVEDRYVFTVLIEPAPDEAVAFQHLASVEILLSLWLIFHHAIGKPGYFDVNYRFV